MRNQFAFQSTPVYQSKVLPRNRSQAQMQLQDSMLTEVGN